MVLLILTQITALKLHELRHRHVQNLLPPFCRYVCATFQCHICSYTIQNFKHPQNSKAVIISFLAIKIGEFVRYFRLPSPGNVHEPYTMQKNETRLTISHHIQKLTQNVLNI